MGRSGGIKTGGRKKGTPNKKTAEQLERAEKILQLLETKYLEKDISKLTPNQRVWLFSSMLEYRSPKLSRVIQAGDPNAPLMVKVGYGPETPIS